jgi:hypothetical protein
VSEDDDESPSEDEDESSQLYDFANSILEECKDAASLSDLITAIYLFNQVLHQRRAPHPLRSDSLKDLATALAKRFSLTHQREDLDRSISLRVEAAREWYEVAHQITDTGGQTQLDVRRRSWSN